MDLTPGLERETVEFLDHQESGHPFQLPLWAHAGSRLLVSRRNGKVCWFANCSVHYPATRALRWIRGLSVNRGPVCDDVEIWRGELDELSEWAGKEDLTHIDVTLERVCLREADEVSIFGSEWKSLGAQRVSLRLDLTKREDEILAGMRKNTRYEVRRAERGGVVVEPSSGLKDIEEFLTLHSRMGDRKNVATDAAEHIRNIIQQLMAEPTRGALLLARQGEKIAGGAVLARCGRRCWYVWGASEKQEQFSAGHILQWHAIQWAKAQGCTEYDFGGYTLGATSGPAFFKEGFGGEVVHFVPSHRRILQPGRYRLSQAASRMRAIRS